MTIFRGKTKDISIAGLGVVEHPDGRIFFVKGAFPGDVGLCQIEQESKRHGFARLIELETPSQLRRDSPCGFQGLASDQCAGCSWMPLPYNNQLALKQQRIEDAMRRAKVTTPKSLVFPIQPAPQEFGYRNRASLKSDGEQIGFIGSDGDTLVDIESCMVLNEKNKEHLATLRARLPEHAWTPSGDKAWVDLEIDDSIQASDVSPKNRLPFRQANTEQNEFMKRWLSQRLDGLDATRALELFCGSGNLSRVISAKTQTNLSVDCIPGPIDELTKLDLAGCETWCADLFSPNNWGGLINRAKNADLLVLDPPRAGFKQLAELVENLPKLEHILYISCDLLNFSRDTSPLASQGWELSRLQPLDQFPQTPHIEILSLLSRRSM